MRYAVAVEPKWVTVKTADSPSCPAGAVRVAVAYVGICHSDISDVSSGTADFPARLGHEVSGIVTDSRSADIAVGARVAAYVDDGCATDIVVPADRIIPLHARCTLLDGALAEPLACVVGGIDMLDLTGANEVALVGAGFMGLLATRLLVARGLSVVAIDPRELARKWALACGATSAADPHDVKPVDRRRFGVVIEASGTAAGLQLAGDLVGVGGTLGMLGYHQSESGLRTIDMESWNYRGLTSVSMHHRDPRKLVQWMHRAQRLSAHGIVRPSELVDLRVALEDSPPYLSGTLPHPGVKAVVEVGGDPT
jgi:threonine dehydrogenase-like Zn-dependent dehydrogenase